MLRLLNPSTHTMRAIRGGGCAFVIAAMSIALFPACDSSGTSPTAPADPMLTPTPTPVDSTPTPTPEPETPTPSDETASPEIHAFVADPPAIDAGDSSTLSWEVTNAASVEIDQGIGDVSLSGTCSVRPANTTTYTLTAHGASGDSTATTRIQVNAAPARICVPMLLTPSSGAVLDNGRTDHLDSIIWRFNWSYCAGADRYHLYVIGPSGTMPTIETDQLAVSSYQWVSDVCIPSSRLTGWTWKVRARVGGQWGDWSRSRSFRVEPPDTDPAPSSSINATISYHDYDASTGWVTFRIVNHASGAALESVEGHIINRNTSASYYGPASSNSPFRASPTQESGGVSSMSAGQTRYLRFRLSGNPAGVPCRAMIKLATAENLGGINTTKTLNFNLP